MKKILRWLDINFEAFFGMVMFYIMLLLILYQIFARALFGNGLAWGEEICKFCYVWVSYFGLSYATRNSIHIEIDAVRTKFPETVQKIMMILSQIVMMVLFFYFFMGCLDNVKVIAQRNMRALSVNISQNWMYMAGPIGYGLGVLRNFQNLVWKIRHFNCSMPVFVNPYSVLDGGLNNFTYNEERKAEYRAKVPEEAYAEVEAFHAKRRSKKKEG